jgi:hypothetical protein
MGLGQTSQTLPLSWYYIAIHNDFFCLSSTDGTWQSQGYWPRCEQFCILFYSSTMKRAIFCRYCKFWILQTTQKDLNKAKNMTNYVNWGWYNLSKHLTVIARFRGSGIFRQYIPKKRTNLALKFTNCVMIQVIPKTCDCTSLRMQKLSLVMSQQHMPLLEMCLANLKV